MILIHQSVIKSWQVLCITVSTGKSERKTSYIK